jgi:hypothetical protein
MTGHNDSIGSFISRLLNLVSRVYYARIARRAERGRFEQFLERIGF